MTSPPTNERSGPREKAAVSLSETDRRSVAAHERFRRSISTDERGVDAIDRDLDEDLVVPWADINPPSRRKESEVSKLLDLLDNLPTGKDSE